MKNSDGKIKPTGSFRKLDSNHMIKDCITMHTYKADKLKLVLVFSLSIFF